MVILQTERLILRQFHIFDVDALDQVFGDPEVMLYGPGVQTSFWVRQWLRGCLEDYPKLGFGPWAVVDKGSSLVIGYAGLFHFPDIDGQPEIEVGYRLARLYWGHGYATEAVAAIQEYAFKILCLPRLIAMIDPQNKASIRVAEKVGMHFEKDVMLEGYTHPDHIYSIKNPAHNEKPGYSDND
jgi:RimJ/RimL family protein N-acetyltransferase